MAFLVITNYADGDVEIIKKSSKGAALRVSREEIKWENTVQSRVVNLRGDVVFCEEGEFQHSRQR